MKRRTMTISGWSPRQVLPRARRWMTLRPAASAAAPIMMSFVGPSWDDTSVFSIGSTAKYGITRATVMCGTVMKPVRATIRAKSPTQKPRLRSVSPRAARAAAETIVTAPSATRAVLGAPRSAEGTASRGARNALAASVVRVLLFARRSVREDGARDVGRPRPGLAAERAEAALRHATLAHDHDDLVDQVRELGHLDRQECRRSVGDDEVAPCTQRLDERSQPHRDVRRLRSDGSTRRQDHERPRRRVLSVRARGASRRSEHAVLRDARASSRQRHRPETVVEGRRSREDLQDAGGGLRDAEEL